MTHGTHIAVSPDVVYAAVDRGELDLADAVALVMLGGRRAELADRMDQAFGDVNGCLPRPMGFLPPPKPNPLIRRARFPASAGGTRNCPAWAATAGTSAPCPPRVPPSP